MTERHTPLSLESLKFGGDQLAVENKKRKFCVLYLTANSQPPTANY
jgi:hypothetical protein